MTGPPAIETGATRDERENDAYFSSKHAGCRRLPDLQCSEDERRTDRACSRGQDRYGLQDTLVGGSASGYRGEPDLPPECLGISQRVGAC